MISIKVASRYAQALFDLAKEKNKIDEYSQELRSLQEFFKENPDLRKCLAHPEISFKDKENLLKRLLGGEISTDIVSTLLLLIKKGHEADVDVLGNLFFDLILDFEGKEVVSVKAPYPLSREEEGNLINAMKSYTGKEILLQTEVDTDIIAGLIITVSGRVIDGSAKNVLDKLRSNA